LARLLAVLLLLDLCQDQKKKESVFVFFSLRADKNPYSFTLLSCGKKNLFCAVECDPRPKEKKPPLFLPRGEKTKIVHLDLSPRKQFHLAPTTHEKVALGLVEV